MKIAHIISSLDSVTGGPPIVAASISSALSRLDCDVDLYGGIKKSIRDEVSVTNEIEGIEDVNVIRYVNYQNNIRNLLNKNLIEKLLKLGPYDVIHFHGIWCLELIQISKYLMRNPAKLIITPHGMLDKWSLTQSYLRKKVALYTYINKILRNASAIHALNAHEKYTLEELGFNNIVTIGNGVFNSYLSDNTSIQTANNNGKNYFLFLGRLHHKKGLDYLAKSWVLVQKIISDVRLVVAGPREDDSIVEFMSLLHKEGLDDTVDIVGSVHGDNKLDLIRGAKAFILPSRQEGFSIAIVESLAQGTPVIISDECHFPEVAENKAGIVCKLDEIEISNSIIKIYSDEVLRNAMKANAINLIKNNYTWEIISQKMLKCYLNS